MEGVEPGTLVVFENSDEIRKLRQQYHDIISSDDDIIAYDLYKGEMISLTQEELEKYKPLSDEKLMELWKHCPPQGTTAKI